MSMTIAMATQRTPSLSALLDLLRALTVPRHVLCIGPGARPSAWVQWMLDADIPRVTLIDASEEAVRSLGPFMAGHPGWQLHHLVVGPGTAPVTFHTAQLPGESGLIDPEHLRELWPNIRSRQSQVRDAVSIDDLLRNDVSTPDWLVVDCLPAAGLLASVDLASLDVSLVVTRCLVTDVHLPDAGASIDASDQRLSSAGFRRVCCLPERHPAFCHAFYLRDVDARHPQVRALVASAMRLPGERVAQLEAQRRQDQEQIQTLSQKCVALTDQLAAGTELARDLIEKSQLLRQRCDDAEAGWAQETRQGQQLRAEMAAIQAEMRSAAEAHVQALADHQQSKKQLEQLAAQRQQQIKALEQRSGQLQTQLLDAEKSAIQLRAEVGKAEAQISLIRELLLPGPRS